MLCSHCGRAFTRYLYQRHALGASPEIIGINTIVDRCLHCNLVFYRTLNSVHDMPCQYNNKLAATVSVYTGRKSKPLFRIANSPEESSIIVDPDMICRVRVADGTDWIFESEHC